CFQDRLRMSSTRRFSHPTARRWAASMPPAPESRPTERSFASSSSILDTGEIISQAVIPTSIGRSFAVFSLSRYAGNVLHFFLIGIASALSGQTFDVTPLTVNQGGVLRVRSSNSAESARMNGRVIRLFPQKEGGALGLMPVPAAEKPGNYKVELIDKNGNSLQSAAVTVQDAHFPTQNLIISEELSKLKPSPGETEAVAAFKNTVSDMRYWNEPFAAPVSGCLTSPFGVKRL